MRTINLNGYIDEEVWYGDEITPSMLHDALYGENSEFSDDVRIILNSYGGSCNAAVRMHDDIRAYPGKVYLVISGTAASAATVLSAAADTLEMTPGSLYMIHDPSTVAWGKTMLRRKASPSRARPAKSNGQPFAEPMIISIRRLRTRTKTALPRRKVRLSCRVYTSRSLRATNKPYPHAA